MEHHAPLRNQHFLSSDDPRSRRTDDSDAGAAIAGWYDVAAQRWGCEEGGEIMPAQAAGVVRLRCCGEEGAGVRVVALVGEDK